ncbi:MAG: hypothetical protein R6W91_03365 [Thermoplasmata archaeon]
MATPGNEATDFFCNPFLFKDIHTIFKIFSLDMHEFLVEFHDLDEKAFIDTLPTLAYFELPIYSIDREIESCRHVDLADCERQGLEELGRIGLNDSSLNRCASKMHADIDKCITLSRKSVQTSADIIEYTKLKTADLAFLRHLSLTLNEIPPQQCHMEFFKHIDFIREFFDDIQDYHEDGPSDCNCVKRLSNLLGNPFEIKEAISGEIRRDMAVATSLAASMEDPEKRSRAQTILEKIEKETFENMKKLDKILGTG